MNLKNVIYRLHTNLGATDPCCYNNNHPHNRLFLVQPTPGTGTGNVGTAGGTTGGTTGGTAGTTGGTTTGTTGGTTDGTTTGTTDGTTTDNNSQDTTDDTTTEPDEQTPKSLVDLDDEDTPKGNIDAKDKTSKTPIAAGIGIIVVAVAALAGLIVFLKKRAK